MKQFVDCRGIRKIWLSFLVLNSFLGLLKLVEQQSLAQQPLAQQPLAHYDSPQLQVTLLQSPPLDLNGESGDYLLIIKPKAGLSAFEADIRADVFLLEGPERLVIDLPNFTGFKNASGQSNTQALNDFYLEKIRLGSYSDKTRFVIDIKNRRKPSYSIAPDDSESSLEVKFSFSQDTATEVTEDVEKPQPSPRAEVTPSPSPAKLPSPSPSPKPSPKATVSPTPTLTPLPPQKAMDSPANPLARPTTTDSTTQAEPDDHSSASATVSGLVFRATRNNKDGALVIDIDEIGKYALTQIQQNVYELVLDDSKLAGEHLLLPQFPPETFSGFEVVTARERAGQVFVRIYVMPGTTLLPYIAEGKLWVKAIAEGE